jgi:ABC-2 type transport system ATP-binding protein
VTGVQTCALPIFTFTRNFLPTDEQTRQQMNIEAMQAGLKTKEQILSEVQEIADRVGIIRKGVLVEVADTASLINRSLRRMRIRFKQPVDTSTITGLPGIKLLSQDDGLSLTLQVEGEMDALIKALAGFPVVDFETERPSLEEIFLAYYEK